MGCRQASPTSSHTHTHNGFNTCARRVEELQRRLDGVEAHASSEHSTNLQLATKLAKVESELRATQASLATSEGEAQTLRRQLRVRCRVACRQQVHIRTASQKADPLLLR